MKPSELLLKGAEEIKRRGWTRDWFGTDPEKADTCEVCAIGALRAAFMGDPFEPNIKNGEFLDAREFLMRAIGGGSVVNWNDANGRTASDVVAAFGTAVELAKADGR